MKLHIIFFLFFILFSSASKASEYELLEQITHQERSFLIYRLKAYVAFRKNRAELYASANDPSIRPFVIQEVEGKMEPKLGIGLISESDERLRESNDDVDYEFHLLDINTSSFDFELKWVSTIDNRPMRVRFKTTSFSTNRPYPMQMETSLKIGEADWEPSRSRWVNNFGEFFKGDLPNSIADFFIIQPQPPNDLNEALGLFNQIDGILDQLEKPHWKNSNLDWYTPNPASLEPITNRLSESLRSTTPIAFMLRKGKLRKLKKFESRFLNAFVRIQQLQNPGAPFYSDQYLSFVQGCLGACTSSTVITLGERIGDICNSAMESLAFLQKRKDAS